jgi:hypothetical protein
VQLTHRPTLARTDRDRTATTSRGGYAATRSRLGHECSPWSTLRMTRPLFARVCVECRLKAASSRSDSHRTACSEVFSAAHNVTRELLDLDDEAGGR